MQTNAYSAYQKNSIMCASKEQLLLILVENAVKYIKIGRQAMIDKKFEKSNESLQKVQNIFVELMVSLDKNAGEWTEELYRIYQFINEKIAEANIKQSIELLEKVIPLVEEVNETWQEAYKLSKK